MILLKIYFHMRRQYTLENEAPSCCFWLPLEGYQGLLHSTLFALFLRCLDFSK